jgi:phage tail sheath protein FI
MPEYLAPGVFVEELPPGSQPIAGVATSVTAFVGRAERGPVGQPIRLRRFAAFRRRFGGLWHEAPMSHAVRDFFREGGREALVVRVFHGDDRSCRATLSLPTGSGTLELEAANPGSWGRFLRATVDHDTRDPADAELFNLRIEALDRTDPTRVVATENYRDLSCRRGRRRFVRRLLRKRSRLVRVRGAVTSADRPLAGTVDAVGSAAHDGAPITDAEVVGDRDTRNGLYALARVDGFNLLCIPPLAPGSGSGVDPSPATWRTAAEFCRERRAILLVDPPADWSEAGDPVAAAADGATALHGAIGSWAAVNAALYFPRIRPSGDGSVAVAPCGAVAGVIARTDARRGVWKAPAGVEASIAGAAGFDVELSAQDLQRLNPLGVNCLRSHSAAGHLVWGARTLSGATGGNPDWKYLPVRRLALFVEASLERGTRWAVFETNGEPLWSRLRQVVGAFLQGLFREGAFQGARPQDAYFVRCGRDTMTQADIDRGIVKVVVGIAPLKPAEFVILTITHSA